MDLRNARPSYGSPETSLYIAAAADLNRYLGVPFMGTAGASESKLLDSQAAVEVSIQILMSALSGAGLIHDVGFLDCADIGSLQLLVLSDEIIGLVKRILRGVKVNPQTIMLDLIEQVGPGGHFIAERKSSSLCRTEIWIPGLMDRNPYSIWDQKGHKSMEERVNERPQLILSTHQPTPLTSEEEQAVSTILSRAEERYA
jgi:trimethylamine--corrinoid protein Co-methyltransferase